MKNRHIAILLALALALLLIAGCAAARNEFEAMPAPAPAAEAPAAAAPRYDSGGIGIYGGSTGSGMSNNTEKYTTDTVAQEEMGAAPAAMPMPTTDPNIAPYGESGSIGQPDPQLKIIRRAWLEMLSKNFDADLAAITSAAAQGGGYVENSNVSGRKPVEWNEPGRYAGLTLRIPSNNLDWFLGYAQSVCEVTRQELGSEDVTAAYFDTESRVGTLRIQLERLENILTQSQKLADVITLETEIARVRYEIEQLTTNLRHWDRMVGYSTVSISLQEETTLTRPATSSPALNERMDTALRRSFNSTVDFLEGLLVGIVAFLPSLIVLLPLAAAAYFIARFAIRRSRAAEAKRKAKREAEKAAKAAASSEALPPAQDDPAQTAGGFSAPPKE